MKSRPVICDDEIRSGGVLRNDFDRGSVESRARLPRGMAIRRRRPFATNVVRRVRPQAGKPRRRPNLGGRDCGDPRAAPRDRAGLRGIASDVSLADAQNAVPWPTLSAAFRRVRRHPRGRLLEVAKALHPKRPALIPMLDSVVQAYLRDDDLGRLKLRWRRALALVRGYKRDLDHNSAAVERSGRRSRHAVTS